MMEKPHQIPSVLPFDAETFYKKFSSDFQLLEYEDSNADLVFDDRQCHITQEGFRPITPTENCIKLMPKTMHELKSIILKRLHIKDDSQYISSNDQRELASILISEVSAVWPDMCKQAPDPFLNKKENRELERKVAVNVVSTVENLFKEYIDKVEAANFRKIFNSTSNICRLKTQLAFDANKRLNILNIRRKLATALRHPPENNDGLSEDSFVVQVKSKLSAPSKVITKGSISRKLQMTRKLAEELARQTELDDLSAKMPVLKKYDMMDHKGPRAYVAKEDKPSSPETSNMKQTQNDSIVTVKPDCNSRRSEAPSLLQKSKSLPQIHSGKFLLEELEIDESEKFARRSSSTTNILSSSMKESKECEYLSKLYDRDPRQDLEKLLEENSIPAMDKDGNDEFFHDIPPLLQALTVTQKRAELKYHDEIKDDSTNDDAMDVVSGLSNDILEIDGVSHLPIQPAAITKMLPKKAYVRISDVRTSNRRNSCEITLKIHGAIYNDFKGEINDEAMKWLDRNLFAGEEIKEVFEEIAKTIKREHLHFERDDFVVNCPNSLQSKQSFASDLLRNTRVNKVWNQKISCCANPPWRSLDADEWRNSPKFGGIGRQEILQLKADAYKELITQEISSNKTWHKRPTKSYSAWLAWWRSTINSEDFYKFISDKDNDFLSKIFHLYESDNEDDDKPLSQKSAIEDPETKARNKLMREKQSKLQELKKEFTNGFWNVNSVLLGGLGKSACEAEAEEKPNSANQAKDQLHPPEISVQDRMERVWNLLRMPENLRLDMAIKYSLDGNCEKLTEAISFWETAADRIVQREEIVADLENFERTASNPNRFFEKGRKGSCLARLDECKMRYSLHKRLQQLEPKVREVVHDVEKICKDSVTFEGRPYLEKMACDKTEMLYWLQQERRYISLTKGEHLSEQRNRGNELPSIATLELL